MPKLSNEVGAFFLAALSLTGCGQSHGENYGTAEVNGNISRGIDAKDWSSYRQVDLRHQYLVQNLIALERNAVTFANKLVPLLNGSDLVLYNVDSPAIEELRQSLANTDLEIHRLLSLEPSDKEQIIFADFAEQLGEARGALFGAYSPGTYNFMKFPGDGLNEVHGLVSKTRVLIEIFADK